MRWISNSWWQEIKAVSLPFFSMTVFLFAKYFCDLSLLINLPSQCCSVTTIVMIIILCCNKPIHWAFSAGYSTAKTPDCHTVFSGRLVNCIFPPAKAMSDKWSEMRRSEEQWVCYHSATGRRTADCNKPQLTSVVPTAGHIHIQIGSPSVCLNPMTCLHATLSLESTGT